MSDTHVIRNVAAITVAIAILTFSLNTGPTQTARAQMSGNGNMTSGSQNQTNMMMGPNVTGSIPMGPTIAKAIASQIHVSLANASTSAEKAVGTNAHAVAVRLGVVHGFLVYMALVVDSGNNFHGVLVDPGSGKVLASTQMSMAAMMQGGMGMMGAGMGMMGAGMGMTHQGMSGYGMGMTHQGMSGYGMGMTHQGMMKGHP
jgi:hypothetical protein